MTKILSFSAIEILSALLDGTKTQTIRPAWKVPFIQGKDYSCFPTAIMNACLWANKTIPDKAKLIKLAGCKYGGTINCEKPLKESGLNWKKANYDIVTARQGIATIKHPKHGLHAEFVTEDRPTKYPKAPHENQDSSYLLNEEGSWDKKPRFKIGDWAQIAWKCRGYPANSWYCSKCGEVVFDIKNPEMIHYPFAMTYHCGMRKAVPKIFKLVSITEVFEITMVKDEYESDTLHYRIFFGGLVDVEGTLYSDKSCSELATRDGFKSDKEMAKYFISNYDLKYDAKKFFAYRWK